MSKSFNSKGRYGNSVFNNPKSLVCLIMVVLLMLPGLCVASASTNAYYDEGYAFGVGSKASIESNIDALYQAATDAGISHDALRAHANTSAAQFASLLSDKLRWIDGVSSGSMIPVSDLYVLNFSDKLVGSLTGECTTFMAHGSPVDGGGTAISKNRDQSIMTMSEITVEEASRPQEGSLYKAAYIDIPQAAETYRFVGSRTAGRWGYGMGVNEHNVSVSDNDANSRDELQFDAGLHDNDVVRLVLERAKTAREGVDVVAALVEAYGQAWNGIMFEIGDPNELWIVEVTGKRWAAKRYVDTVTARSNQFQIEDDYDLCSDDLVSFAQETWGVEPNADGKINFRQAYGSLELYPEDNEDIHLRPSAETLYNTQMRYLRAMELLDVATANGAQLVPADFMRMSRDHFDSYTLPSGAVVEMNQTPFYSTDLADWYSREWYEFEPANDYIETHMYIRSPCGHDLGWGATSATGLLYTQPDLPPVMLHSIMPPCMSTFVPFYPMQTQVDSRYTEPTASILFNTIATKAFRFYTLFIDPVRAEFDPYEEAMLGELVDMNKAYSTLAASGQTEAAARMLTAFSAEKADQAYLAAERALDSMNATAAGNSAW